MHETGQWTDYKRAATRPKAKRTFLQVLSHRVKVKIGTGSRQNGRKQAKWQEVGRRAGRKAGRPKASRQAIKTLLFFSCEVFYINI